MVRIEGAVTPYHAGVPPRWYPLAASANRKGNGCSIPGVNLYCSGAIWKPVFILRICLGGGGWVDIIVMA